MTADQLSLDDLATTTGHHHPATSVAAALAVLPKTGTQRRRVYEAIRCCSSGFDGGLTDDEIADWLRLPGNSVRPRRRELELGGHIRRAGFTRPNRYGNPCDVWVTT